MPNIAQRESIDCCTWTHANIQRLIDGVRRTREIETRGKCDGGLMPKNKNE